MKVSEVMTRDVQTVRSDQPVQEAASFMLSTDSGSIPVMDGEFLIEESFGAAKGIDAVVNHEEEDAYWRESYQREPYYVSGRTYEQYRPAYELGWSSVGRYEGDFESVEPRMADDWRARHSDGLAWDEARPAARAAWDRASMASTARGGDDRSVDNVLDTDDVVDVLNDLLESSRDGEYGFNSCAEHAKSQQLKSLFQRHAQECAAAAAELEHEIRRLGGEPASGGSMAGALHRGWVSVKSALSIQDDKAVLEECERGEDAAIARYRKALKHTLPMEVQALVERQARGAQRNHDEVRSAGLVQGKLTDREGGLSKGRVTGLLLRPAPKEDGCRVDPQPFFFCACMPAKACQCQPFVPGWRGTTKQADGAGL